MSTRTGSQNPIYYDISTPEKIDAAYLSLFRLLDEDWNVYCWLIDFKPESVSVCEPCQKDIHRLCEKCACESDPECKRRASIKRTENMEAAQQKALYNAAKNGEPKAAIKLLRSRKGYEYEHVVEEGVIDATEAATGGGQ